MSDESKRMTSRARCQEKTRSETRTTGSEGQRGSAPCSSCDQPIRGRRRNGFCSDRCRMAARREDQQRRRRELVNAVQAAFEKLRIYIGCDHE